MPQQDAAQAKEERLRRQESVLTTVLWHADQAPERTAWLQFLPDGSTRPLSRGKLVERATGVAEALQGEGVRPGEIVALLMTHTESLAAAWLGSVMHGAIPTVLAEPSVRMQPAEYGRMLSHLFGYLSPAATIVDGNRCIATATQVAAAVRETRIVDIATIPRAARLTPRLTDSTATIALQHSSGTTGRHKGVMMTNGQILSQVDSYARAIKLDPASDKIASWLPLYHDMGFIACFVMPLVYGIETVQMSAFEWVTRPWMLPAAVSTTRATLSWLPNFAYHLLAARCTPDRLDGVDLSSWRQVINCSEPCTASAFDHFHERFAPYGLVKTALGVSYASAETIFAVTEGGVRRPLVVRSVESREYHAESRLIDSDSGIRIIGCGTVIDGASIEIRNEQLDVAPVDTIGEVWVKAPFLMKGYFRRPELDAEVFRAGWYRTGDLGCVDPDGELYVTGRLKDLIIVGGINIPPQDVEEIVSKIPGVIAGRAVAIGPWDTNLETQRLVVLVEAHSGESAERNRINVAIRGAVAAQTQVQVSDVRVFPRGTLHKSTSGKLSRPANLQLYENGPAEDSLWA